MVRELVDGTDPAVKDTTRSKPDAAEWNLNNIRAPEVWSTYGDRGEGIVVASIDTGVQYNHPALVNQYRGNIGGGTFNHNYNWFDPLHVCPHPAPCDTFGHGTHTMGTMVGDDGGRTRSASRPTRSGSRRTPFPMANGTMSRCWTSGQWIVAPTNLNGRKPKPELRPNIVSNSWGLLRRPVTRGTRRRSTHGSRRGSSRRGRRATRRILHEVQADDVLAQVGIDDA